MSAARGERPGAEADDGRGEPLSPLDQIGSAGMVGAWFRTTLVSLGIRDFRLFYIGQGISLVGTWVRRTSMGWLVYQLTGSKALLGLITGLATFPMFVLSPTAGAIADKVDKRRMIVLTQVVAALSSGAIAALVFTGWIHVWHLAVLASISGIAFAFEMPARQSFIFELVGRERLTNAIALNSALVNLSRIFGPALAGVLMGTIGMGWCFTVDALSYVVVTVTLLMLVIAPVERPPRGEATWVERFHAHVRDLREGLVEVARNRRVRILLLLVFLVGVLGWSFQTLMPAIAPDYLGLTETQYGALMSMFGVGAIGGALLVASHEPERSPRMHVFGGVWVMASGMLLVAGLGAALGKRTAAFWAVSGALALAGFGAITFMSTANTLIQTSVEDRIRGRVMGIWAVAFGGSLPLGAFLAGAVAEATSPYFTIAASASLLIVCSLVVYARLPRRRQSAP
ncbi:MAG TPA: MFS transporter [Planctomycetota bacterium]|nr:MFS transporter [Planctomycetota bacterium]